MQNVILVIHIIACLVMIGLVLVQKSEGGGLGIGGGSGNPLMSGRGAAGALVRTTMIFGAIFFATSLALTSIANRSSDNRSGLERVLDESNPETGPSGPIDLFDPSTTLLNERGSTASEPEAAPQPELQDPTSTSPTEMPSAEDTEETPANPQ